MTEASQPLHFVMSDAFFQDHPRALQITRLVLYLPIALFAENLRAQSSVLSSICSSSSLTTPLTGCVRDLSRLWYLNLYELFGSFETGRQSVVASVRNGITFPLANHGFLELIGLTGGLIDDLNGLDHARPVTVSVTFIYPFRTPSTLARSSSFWTRHCINGVHAICHLGLGTIFGYYGLYTGAILMVCLLIVDVVQAVLRHATSAIFSCPVGTDGKTIPIFEDAPLDVHVIAGSWNASHLDVVIGYSAQLHALTNIPIRSTRPRLILWLLRFLDVTLVVQAAALACSSSGNIQVYQSLGSVAWLVCYLLMLIPAHYLKSRAPALFLEYQPGCALKLRPFVFSKRSAALAFVAKLPVDQREQVGFSWMDQFIPNNSRRQEWLNDVQKSSLFSGTEKDDLEAKDNLSLIREVKARLDDPLFKYALKEFESQARRCHTS